MLLFQCTISSLGMSSSLKKSYSIFKILYNCSPTTFEAIVSDNKLGKDLLLGSVEYCWNLLFTELPLTDEERQLLRSEKELIRAIADRGSGKSVKVRHKKLQIIHKNRRGFKIILQPIIEGSLQCLLKSSS